MTPTTPTVPKRHADILWNALLEIADHQAENNETAELIRTAKEAINEYQRHENAHLDPRLGWAQKKQSGRGTLYHYWKAIKGRDGALTHLAEPLCDPQYVRYDLKNFDDLAYLPEKPNSLRFGICQKCLQRLPKLQDSPYRSPLKKEDPQMQTNPAQPLTTLDAVAHQVNDELTVRLKWNAKTKKWNAQVASHHFNPDGLSGTDRGGISAPTTTAAEALQNALNHYEKNPAGVPWDFPADLTDEEDDNEDPESTSA